MSNENEIEKTSRGIAHAMFEELELLRAGKSTPQQARAKASIANCICTVSRLEMDFARFVSSTRAEDENDSGLKALPMA
jgi:hypothetical protein